MFKERRVKELAKQLLAKAFAISIAFFLISSMPSYWIKLN